MEEFSADWNSQCEKLDEDSESYGHATMPIIRDFAEKQSDSEWAIAVKGEHGFMAAAVAIKAMQKGFNGYVLRIREVTVCPLLDYGELDENTYIDTLVELLNGAIKLSESDLMASHIKLHLRSPADSAFFRTFGNTLDSKDVFAATETHGAWLVVSKAPQLQLAK
ncbi:hypothetical protein EB810_01405 [Altererythrobacter sp. FM1]|nr:hypothetical protein EB810_01405 [Altererythrobacter sp. FM1]